MTKRASKRRPVARRYLAARVDASVGSICRRIEQDYALPKGSVSLLLPTGKRARSDKRIGPLLDDWGWDVD